MSLPAYAIGPCIAGPSSSTNKSIHLIGSAVLTATVSNITNSPTIGVTTAIAIDTIRELTKPRCEYYSIAYDIVGIALGLKLNKNIRVIGNQIFWTYEF